MDTLGNFPKKIGSCVSKLQIMLYIILKYCILNSRSTVDANKFAVLAKLNKRQ